MDPHTQQIDGPDSDFDSREFYARKASSYDAEMDSPSTRKVRLQVKDLVSRYSQDGGAVLDFGCGTGGDVASFLEQGRRVLAYDSSSEMLAQLRSRYREAVRERTVIPLGGELTDLYAQLAHFDPIRAVVANFGVINHLPHLGAFADLVSQRLTALQVVVLGVHNPLYLPDMGSRWWWRGLWAGRREGVILCEGTVVRTRRYFMRTLIQTLSPLFQLRAAYGLCAPMRLLAFERVA
ncbi:MAG: class I SAM-dependent methyltransferase [Steroidobacteraceae bacterium]